MLRIPKFRQVAALPFRDEAAMRRVMLITSLGTRRWILPKGNIEPGLTAPESAEFEAFEEAGVVGRLASSSFGTYSYDKIGEDEEAILHHVRVYPLKVQQTLEAFPEQEKRERKWMDPDEAIEAVDEPSLKELIAKFTEET